MYEGQPSLVVILDCVSGRQPLHLVCVSGTAFCEITSAGMLYRMGYDKKIETVLSEHASIVCLFWASHYFFTTIA
jgi:hypothetical protein